MPWLFSILFALIALAALVWGFQRDSDARFWHRVYYAERSVSSGWRTRVFTLLAASRQPRDARGRYIKRS